MCIIFWFSDFTHKCSSYWQRGLWNITKCGLCQWIDCNRMEHVQNCCEESSDWLCTWICFCVLNVILVTKQREVPNTVQICTYIERSTEDSPQQNEYMCSLFYSLCWVDQILTFFFPCGWLLVFMGFCGSKEEEFNKTHPEFSASIFFFFFFFGWIFPPGFAC